MAYKYDYRKVNYGNGTQKFAVGFFDDDDRLVSGFSNEYLDENRAKKKILQLNTIHKMKR